MDSRVLELIPGVWSGYKGFGVDSRVWSGFQGF